MLDTDPSVDLDHLKDRALFIVHLHRATGKHGKRERKQKWEWEWKASSGCNKTYITVINSAPPMHW